VVDACRDAGDEVIAPPRDELDLEDPDATRAAIRDAGADMVIHLAARASVAESWEQPAAVLQSNLMTSLNLLEALRAHASDTRVLVASSGEVYGPPARLPVGEDAPLRPQNPYAVSKASVDLLAGMYADSHDMPVVRARAFNHAGPGQSDAYVVSSLCRQVASEIRGGASPIRVVTGNPDTRRDFTDVRDVARAYRALAAGGEPRPYNVCSGRTASVRDLLAELSAHTRTEIEHVVDPALVRAHEVTEIRGSHQQLTEATGWQPEIPLERTLADTVAWWAARLHSGTTPPE
jgi:GDP-4-dehydro-6-deoxy-D-mannose reductase